MDEHPLENKKLFYRFTADEHTIDTMDGGAPLWGGGGTRTAAATAAAAAATAAAAAAAVVVLVRRTAMIRTVISVRLALN